MPKVETVQKELDAYKNASGRLRNGEAVEVDGVLFCPSMAEGDKECDLDTVERMISRLKVQLVSAQNQELAKGKQVQSADGSKLARFAKGAPALASALELDQAECARIIPSGAEGRVSKRDVRTYSNHKKNGTLKEYFKRSLIRNGVELSDDPQEAESELEEMVAELMNVEVKKAPKAKADQASETPEKSDEKPEVKPVTKPKKKRSKSKQKNSPIAK
jgi:hypothetical protein